MGQQRITASATIEAPASQLYAIITDYRDGHPHIVPQQYFQNWVVERGGVGAGTVISFDMRAPGKTQRFRQEISEPEPGRVVAEANDDGSAVTTFTVDPRDGGRSAEVTIATELRTRDGVAGLLEGFFARLFLRRVYTRELAQLAEFARQRAA